jgi:hypothetical protein
MNKLVTLVGPANRFVYIQKVVLPKLVNALYFCCLQCRHRTIPGAAPYSPALTKLIRVPQLRLGRFGELRRKPYNSKARLRAFDAGLQDLFAFKKGSESEQDEFEPAFDIWVAASSLEQLQSCPFKTGAFF